MPTYDFTGQVALVTGASSGMGLATAKAFAAAGAAVVMADRDEAALRPAAERLVADGRRALAVARDVADEAQVAAMVGRAVDAFGRLDMAFNNAGIQIAPSLAAVVDDIGGFTVRGPRTSGLGAPFRSCNPHRQRDIP